MVVHIWVLYLVRLIFTVLSTRQRLTGHCIHIYFKLNIELATQPETLFARRAAEFKLGQQIFHLKYAVLREFFKKIKKK